MVSRPVLCLDLASCPRNDWLNAGGPAPADCFFEDAAGPRERQSFPCYSDALPLSYRGTGEGLTVPRASSILKKTVCGCRAACVQPVVSWAGRQIEAQDRTRDHELRLLLFRLLVGISAQPAAHCVLEFADPFSQAPTQVRQLARSEDDQHDQQDEEQVGRL